MVAWRFTIYTPEYPKDSGGRDIVVIANDITFQIGSFGPKEDIFFFKCSQYARQRGIPRIYLSANSGARIGLAKELMDLYRISWTDPSAPEKGFEYLYLLEKDLLELRERFRGFCGDKLEDSVCLETRLCGEEIRYVITDIIGIEDGLGVENLQGSVRCLFILFIHASVITGFTVLGYVGR
jgi:acetyl-CoA carboxylase/biotin carboxylase 1